MKKDWPNSRNDLDYEEEQENARHALEQFIQENQIVTGPEELEALERNLSELLDQFHAVIVGDVLQRSIESEPVKEAVAELIECHPKKLKNQGTVRVMVRTASGILVPVWVSYYTVENAMVGKNVDRRDCMAHWQS